MDQSVGKAAGGRRILQQLHGVREAPGIARHSAGASQAVAGHSRVGPDGPQDVCGASCAEDPRLLGTRRHIPISLAGKVSD